MATEPCKTCRFLGPKGCGLVQGNQLGKLMDEGLCRPWSWIESWTGRFLRMRSVPRDLHEDLLQELQVFLRRPQFRFPEDFPARIRFLRSYLRKVVLNFSHDYLRKEKLAPKVRCGACVYFGPSQQCRLAMVINGGGTERPNPHQYSMLDPLTNPAALKPPCRSFFWRYRPQSIEEIGERCRRQPSNPALEEKEAAELVALALGDLAQTGKAGFRRAYVLKEQFFSGRTAVSLAEELNCSEKTVRRDLKAALAALKLILRERFHVEESDLF